MSATTRNGVLTHEATWMELKNTLLITEAHIEATEDHAHRYVVIRGKFLKTERGLVAHKRWEEQEMSKWF